MNNPDEEPKRRTMKARNQNKQAKYHLVVF